MAGRDRIHFIVQAGRLQMIDSRKARYRKKTGRDTRPATTTRVSPPNGGLSAQETGKTRMGLISSDDGPGYLYAGLPSEIPTQHGAPQVSHA